MVKKIIIHCGASKNGSTALQNSLIDNCILMQQKKITFLAMEYVPYIKSHQRLLEQDLICLTHEEFPINDEVLLTASMSHIYEFYTNLRKERNFSYLTKLEKLLLEKVCQVLISYDTLVISSESFEISLCLRDPFFKGFLRKLSKLANIDLVYYQPDAGKHVLGSWQEWGWIEQYKYSEWLKLYVKKVSATQFFSGAENTYWGNLICPIDWLDYFDSERKINLLIYAGIDDVVKHFHQEILELPVSHLSLPKIKNANRSWPKSCILYFPIFYDFFSGDHEKWAITRQLMIDNEFRFSQIPGDVYNNLLQLTRKFLSELQEADQGSFLENTEIDIPSQIDLIFQGYGLEVSSPLIHFLMDAIYFNHRKQV